MMKRVNENYNNYRTGINHYDILLKNKEYGREVLGEDYEIINMTPKEYIQRCADLFGVTYEYLTSTRIDEALKNCYIEMSNQTRFNIPMINYKKGSQEGLHRAICSLLLEEETIPVMIITEYVK